MKTISNHAAVAKAIRNELKKRGLQCSVTSRSYAGGNSVTARVFADLRPEQRKEIESFADRYEYGHFDGMTGCYEYSNRRDDLPQVKFIFVEFEYSDEAKQAARDYIGEISGIQGYEVDHYTWMALTGAWGNFWDTYKPTMAA